MRYKTEIFTRTADNYEDFKAFVADNSMYYQYKNTSNFKVGDTMIKRTYKSGKVVSYDWLSNDTECVSEFPKCPRCSNLLSDSEIGWGICKTCNTKLNIKEVRKITYKVNVLECG